MADQLKPSGSNRKMSAAEFLTLVPRTPFVRMRPEETEALERLLEIATVQTEQGGRVADFLLAWWNAAKCGGFDLTMLWHVDDAAVEDMFTVMRLLERVEKYPDDLGFDRQFEQLLRTWRPVLGKAP